LRIPWSRAWPPALAFLAPLCLYGATRAPDLGSIDSGELAAVCSGLQIAHPTGYPLYTLIGRLACLVLPGPTPIARLNLLSVLLGAICTLGAFRLFRRVSRSTRPGAGELDHSLLALGAALLWAVHPALWRQALGNEVHALQAAIVVFVLWLVSGRTDLRQRLLAAYLLGLGFANHMTILYLVPPIVVGALAAGELPHLRRRSVLLALAGALTIPLCLYLYLPIRSLADPLLDWGDPTNPERFFRHVGAAQYRVWLFASSEGFGQNLLQFIRELASPLGVVLLLAAGAGAIALARRSPADLARLGLALLIGSLWASGYEIHDLEPYYLVPRIALAGLAVAGAASVLPVRAGRSLRRALLLVPLVAALLLAGSRWSGLTRSGDRFIRLYATSLLDSLPSDAILLTRHWDIVVSPLIYLQQIEGLRPDVTVVDTELFRRSWYFPQLRRTDPTLLAPIEDRVTLFLEQLRLFERGEAYDPQKIESRFRGVIAGVFEAHRQTRPVYHTPEIEPAFYGGWYGIPEALAVRMVVDPRLAPEAEPLKPESWAGQAGYLREAVRQRAWAFPIELARSRIAFLEQLGRTEEALRWRAALDDFEAIPVQR
jgi:hypothetical protein